jgi:hypothetical protein
VEKNAFDVKKIRTSLPLVDKVPISLKGKERLDFSPESWK